MNKRSISSAVSLGASLLLIGALLACGSRPSPPETSHLVYEVSKTLSTNCGLNLLCIDFDGVASFASSNGACNPVTFFFDDRSWMTLVVETQPIYPPTQVNLYFSETDTHSQNIQGPWSITLQSPTPNGYWPFHFTTNPTAPDLPLQKGAKIQGHYAVSVLGGQQVSAASLTIHAEADVVSGTRLCSAN
jgi:hypothetical protein